YPLGDGHGHRHGAVLTGELSLALALDGLLARIHLHGEFGGLGVLGRCRGLVGEFLGVGEKLLVVGAVAVTAGSATAAAATTAAGEGDGECGATGRQS